MKRILIFKVGAIGDLLMTTPLVRQLGETSDFAIDYMCGDSVKSILIGNKYINNIISFEEKFFSKINVLNLFKYVKFLFFLFKKRRDYDYVLILDKHFIFNFSFFITGYNNIFGFNRLGKEGRFLDKTIYWDKSKREVEYYLEFLDLVGIRADFKKQEYDFFGGIINKLNNEEFLNENENFLVSNYLKNKNKINDFIKELSSNGKRIIGIATGGGNLLMPKNDCRWWSLDNWTNLAKELINMGNSVLLLGSKNDRKIEFQDQNFFDQLGNFNIHETIYLVSKIDLVISQEAGFIHFVGCTNTKLITIAGPTNPYRFHPFDNNGNKKSIGWIWKEDFECYNEYGGFDVCKGDEIDKVRVEEVLKIV